MIEILIRVCLILPVFFCGSLNAQPIDYKNQANWYTHPGNSDAFLDKIELSSSKDDSNRVGDVFFIHTTTLINSPASNDRLKTPSSRRMARTLIMSQASAFGSCYRIWAPKYRQVSLYRLKNPGKKTNKAIDKAYKDIEAAFLQFLSETKDRPFVLAAHGQGSFLAWKLLNDHIDRNPVILNRMVYASLAGFPFTQMELKRNLDSIKYCNEPTSTGCLLSWQTIGEEGYKDPVLRLRKSWELTDKAADSNRWLCINPVTWRTDPVVSNPELHLGSVKTIHNGNDLKIVMSGHIEARIVDGFVQINKPRATLFNSTGRNYHMYDYQLFYLNVSENSCQRLKEWLKNE